MIVLVVIVIVLVAGFVGYGLGWQYGWRDGWARAEEVHVRELDQLTRGVIDRYLEEIETADRLRDARWN